MATREGNKFAHPGLPDLPAPKKNRAKTKTSKKAGALEETLQQLSGELAQIEDESAADYANDKTPGVPPKTRQQKKTEKTKKPLPVARGGDGMSESQDITDSDLNEGSDIEKTTKKKQKSGAQLRNTVQSMRKVPPMELGDGEEPMAEGRTTQTGQGGKGVEASKGKKQKNSKKGATIRKVATTKGTATQKEASDVEMQGKFSLSSMGTSLTKSHLYRCDQSSGSASQTRCLCTEASSSGVGDDCTKNTDFQIRKLLTFKKSAESSGEEAAPPPKKTRTTKAGSKPPGRATHNAAKKGAPQQDVPDDIQPEELAVLVSTK